MNPYMERKEVNELVGGLWKALKKEGERIDAIENRILLDKTRALADRFAAPAASEAREPGIRNPWPEPIMVEPEPGPSSEGARKWEEAKRKPPAPATTHPSNPATMRQVVPGTEEPFDDMEGRGPCGGRRCFLSHARDGVWIHSSKSYDSCSERRPAPASAGSDAGPWTMEQRQAATEIAATVAFWEERADDRRVALTCAEIAKHAHLFVPPPAALDVEKVADELIRWLTKTCGTVRKLNPGVSFVGAGEEQGGGAGAESPGRQDAVDEAGNGDRTGGSIPPTAATLAARSGQDGTDEGLARKIVEVVNAQVWPDSRSWSLKVVALVRSSSDAELAGLKEHARRTIVQHAEMCGAAAEKSKRDGQPVVAHGWACAEEHLRNAALAVDRLALRPLAHDAERKGDGS